MNFLFLRRKIWNDGKNSDLKWGRGMLYSYYQLQKQETNQPLLNFNELMDPILTSYSSALPQVSQEQIRAEL